MRHHARTAAFFLAASLIILLWAPPRSVLGQQAEIQPVTLGQAMPDFSLPALKGGSLHLSSLKGKNVVLIFPRGFAGEGRWCTICHYAYADLLDVESKGNLRKTHNLEFVIVLPYGKDVVEQWLAAVPEQLEKIKTWKNPPEPVDEATRTRAERSKRLFPKVLSMKPGEVPAPFPILIDADRKVAKGLGIFATEWGGSKVDQDIPTVFILDPQGVVRFKYFSQNTADRPSYDYLMKIVEAMNKGLLTVK